MKIRKTITILGFIALCVLNQSVTSQVLNENTYKIGRTLGLIDAWYVDSTDIKKLTESTILNCQESRSAFSLHICQGCERDE
jgi:hypothetical protein